MADADLRFTVGDFKKHLEVFPNDWEIDFSGLTFYRLKARGNTLVNVEFNEHVELLQLEGEKKPVPIYRLSQPAGDN